MHRVTATAAAVVLGSLLSPAQAVQAPPVADSSFSNRTAFLLAVGDSQTESFEAVTPGPRGLADIVTPLLTLRTTTTPIGLFDAPDGFGGAASNGQRFVSVYLPNQGQGTVEFLLAAPSQAFALDLVDLGEAPGTLTLTTDTGFHAGGTVLANFNGGLGSGNQQFFGITQAQAFSRVWLSATGVDDAYAIDQVRLQSPVPEPGQLALAALGLAALAGCWRVGGKAR